MTRILWRNGYLVGDEDVVSVETREVLREQRDELRDRYDLVTDRNDRALALHWSYGDYCKTCGTRFPCRTRVVLTGDVEDDA